LKIPNYILLSPSLWEGVRGRDVLNYPHPTPPVKGEGTLVYFYFLLL